MPPPQKSPAKYTALDMPVVGQNATCLADLLNALKEEYLYNTRVMLVLSNLIVESSSDGAQSEYESRQATIGRGRSPTTFHKTIRIRFRTIHSLCS